MANILAIASSLPPPPKFAQQGPADTDDWAQMYRWLNDLYRILLAVQTNAGQGIIPSVQVQANVALRGEIDQLYGLIQMSLFRPSGGGGRGSAYVAAAQPNPWVIPSSVHGQGTAFVVQTFSGPLVNGNPTGTASFAQVDLDATGNGDVTITYADGVGCVVIRG